MIGAIGEAKKPEADQPEAKKATEKTPEGQKTDPQPKAATASTHES